MLAQSKAMSFLMRAGIAKALNDAKPPWRFAGPARTGLNLERIVRFRRALRSCNWPLSGWPVRCAPTTAKPGLVFDGRGAGNIEVEIWEMDERPFGSFVALIPAPLGIGTLNLEDGTSVKGFLCEAYAVGDAEDITKWGGWRAWLASR